jgi:CPA1 family monovalent cation:H+ antiporter
MHGSDSSFYVNTLVTMLMVSSAVAIFVRWIKLPYSLALVIVGLVIGLFKLLPGVELTPDLTLMVFLPALLFEASWNIDVQELKRDRVPLVVLSTLGVLVSMGVIAALLHYLLGFDLKAALLFGAMVSATDPISVIALFRKLGIDRRLTMLLEGESLFNDGTSVVLFKLVLALAVYGQDFSAPNFIFSFIFVCAGGCLLGTAIGLATSYITRFFDDHLPEIMLTTIAAYGSFILAESLHVSPVLAVVTTGIVIGNYGSRSSMSATTRLAVTSFWEYAAFVVNSLVFLLIGMRINLTALAKYQDLIVAAIAATIISRMVVVYFFCPILSSKRVPIPPKWMHLLFWGGLRGALSMAMALSIPLEFPMREQLILMTFAAVLFTLLIPGLTIEPLVKVLKMLNQDPKLAEYMRLRGKLILENESIKELQRLRDDGKLSGESFDELHKETVDRVENIELKIKNLQLADSSLKDLLMKEARLRLLERKKDSLVSMGKQGILDQHNFESLMLEIDEKIDALNGADGHQKDKAIESNNSNEAAGTQVAEGKERRSEPGAQAET